MRKSRILIGIVIAVVMIGLIGCRKKSDNVITNDVLPSIGVGITNTPTPTNTPTLTPTPIPEITVTPEITYEGMNKSMLTGLWVKEETAAQRPIAVMLNNIIYANPQSGIGDAQILYEALVEGGITRLMGLFEGIDPNSLTAARLGSVRSARHYYVSFADEYDAIFLHYGQTTYAQKKIKALGIDTINGMSGVGVNSFYRDKSIKAPHNAFTSLDGIQKAITAGNYRTTYEEAYEGHYSFYENDTNLTSDISATKLKIRFSKQITPVFYYDENTRLYLRNQFDDAHIDANTKEQLRFKNILVQFVKEWDIDKNGYQTMELEDASGDGYYITNGNLINITWKKNEQTRKMRYYTLDGKELTMNAGKTYIAIFPDNRVKDVAVE